MGKTLADVKASLQEALNAVNELEANKSQTTENAQPDQAASSPSE